MFENAPPIQRKQVVRIAGVDVGQVSDVEPVGGDSPAVVVTMKLDEDALPLHEDATIKVRPRIFFEGNLFFDLKPGTPTRRGWTAATRFPPRRPRRPSRSTRCSAPSRPRRARTCRSSWIGYGEALNGEPEPGEDDDQDPEVQGETGAEALNDSLEYSADSLRGGAIVNDALLGSELHDLSKLIGAQQKIFAALGSNEEQLKELITNFNVTTGALASEETNLSATIRELPQVLEAAQPALDNLNAAFPPTRAWALEMIPGVRETPATIDAGFPWIRQTTALLSPDELQGLVDDLRPAVDDLAAVVNGQVQLLPRLDDFNRCQLNVVLPTGDQRIQDGNLSTGLRNYEEFFQTLVSLTGESQNFDGNGIYVRFQAGGGGYPIQTPSAGPNGPLHSTASYPPVGTRPAKTRKPPYKPNVKCHTQPVPDLSAARTGPAP